ncbi:MAG: TonB-dependent receptor, partial [Gammaproteobacteria bacterium]
MNRLIFAALVYLPVLSVAEADDQTPEDLDVIEVVDVSPLQGSGIEAEKIPANVQTASAQQMEKAQSISLSEYMNRYLGSVHINEAQNNPLQPDV